MLFHTHVLFGITSFLVLKDYFSGGNELIFFLLVLLGSVLPDIDEYRSKIKQWSGFIGSIITFFTKHRGIFHSFLFALLLSFVVMFVWNHYYASALFIGYLTHLIADSLTPMGIPVLYPFSEFKVRGPIKVGSIGEWVILIGLVVLIVKELVF